MKTYGYIRVSSIDQNEDRQIIAMQKGVKFGRPAIPLPDNFSVIYEK